MSFSKLIFKLVDEIFKNPQNPRELREKYANVKIETDIQYGPNAEEERLDIHYFQRPDNSPYPVIMEIHGGGFSAGDKKYRTVLSSFYAKETGAFVVNVNYGLGGKTVWPTPLHQLVNAINWIYDNREKYNLDLSHFVVTGDSAGGYYSAMLATLQDSDFLQEMYKTAAKIRIGAVVLNCGVYDLMLAINRKMFLNLGKGIARDFAGIDLEEIDSYKYIEGVSPIDHLSSNFPKAFIIYAEQDFFCGGQGETLCQKLTELGVYHEAYWSTTLEDNHTFPLIWNTEAAKEALEKTLSFLNRYFKDEI